MGGRLASIIATDPIAWIPPQLAVLRTHRYRMEGMSEGERKAVATWLKMRNIALGAGPLL